MKQEKEEKVPENLKKDFNTFLEEFNKDPQTTQKRFKDFVQNLTDENDKKLSFTEGVKKAYKNANKADLVFYLFIILIIALIPFGDGAGMYICGCIFFFVGYLLNIYSPGGFEVIFLFSHGLTGLGLMLAGLLIRSGTVNNFEGLSTSYYYLIALLGVLLLASFIIAAMYSLSSSIRKVKNIKIISIVLFFILLVCTKFNSELLHLFRYLIH